MHMHALAMHKVILVMCARSVRLMGQVVSELPSQGPGGPSGDVFVHGRGGSLFRGGRFMGSFHRCWLLGPIVIHDVTETGSTLNDLVDG